VFSFGTGTGDGSSVYNRTAIATISSSSDGAAILHMMFQPRRNDASVRAIVAGHVFLRNGM
jgi:hypothetical protein